MVAEPSGPHHRVFALSLENGATLPGWPVDVGAALAAQGRHFNAPDQNQRGALTLLDGRVYVPYGGHFGDCGDYRGWVVGIGLRNPGDVVGWNTRARGGGIWAPGGIASDGRSLFFATGNTFGARQWSDGEAVFRLGPDLARSDRTHDYFAPADWRALDAGDADLGGAHPLLLPSMPRRRRAAAFRHWCWRWARTARLSARRRRSRRDRRQRWSPRPSRPARSAPHRRLIRPPTASLSGSRVRAPIARCPAAATR